MPVDAEDVPNIPGLTYLPEYISESEERALASAIDGLPWDTSWSRRRQPYGARYGTTESPSLARPIPEWGIALARRMQSEGITERLFDHLLGNEYLPGQGIAMHRDYEPFDRTVVSLSLLAACVMDFREVATERRESLLLERRSLLILSDQARYQWEHGIAWRQADRWHGIRFGRQRRLSITFRSSKVIKPSPSDAPR